MQQKPVKPFRLRELPGPGSWTRTILGALIGLLALAGGRIGGQTGVIVALVAGTAIAIGGLLYWASRPDE
jgi:hypothetical protein